MKSWKEQIDLGSPYWADYRHLLGQFPEHGFPDISVLNSLRPATMVNGPGLPIRFVAAAGLPGVAYENHIYETGEVSTRDESWHDLFNALVWFRLPRIKAAMNQLHYGKLDQQHQGRRGDLRDALTLLDESGAIIVGSNINLLHALGARDWKHAFIALRDAWLADTRVVVCGHALLEKFLNPYKAITAHVLLLHLEDFRGCVSDIPMQELDVATARGLLSGDLLSSPASLSPLPLMGIPGWRAEAEQDQAFYDDQGVFRPPRKSQSARRVSRLGLTA